MISQRAELPIVAFSVRVYQALLVAYPSKFQQEYGAEMVQVFQDCCLRALRQGGTNGMARLWTVTLFDLIQSVISEHAQKEIDMKKEMKPEDIRRSGWALILGAVSLILINWSVRNLSEFAPFLLVFVSLPLLAFGVLGLRHRYGEKVGRFGKNILLIGVILGPLTSLLGIVIGIFTGDERLLWTMAFGGPAVLLACLTLFGIVALYKKPLPHWNILPIIAGLPYGLPFLSYIVIDVLPGYRQGSGGMPDSLFDTFFTIQCIALAALGYILKSDVPQDTVAPA